MALIFRWRHTSYDFEGVNIYIPLKPAGKGLNSKVSFGWTCFCMLNCKVKGTLTCAKMSDRMSLTFSSMSQARVWKALYDATLVLEINKEMVKHLLEHCCPVFSKAGSAVVTQC